MQHGYPWHTPEIVLETPKSYRQWWDDLGATVFYPYFAGLDNVDDKLALDLAGNVDKFYLNTAKWALMEDAYSVLQAAGNMRYTNIMLTNNAAGIEHVFAALGIEHFFSLIVNSANTGAEKPNCRAFMPILDKHDVDQIAFTIGDSISADVAGANEIGVPSILVGKTSDEATICVERLSQILNAIDL